MFRLRNSGNPGREARITKREQRSERLSCKGAAFLYAVSVQQDCAAVQLHKSPLKKCSSNRKGPAKKCENCIKSPMEKC